MKKIVLVALLAISAVSCKQNSKFEVSGVVEKSNGDTLYLEKVGLSQTVLLDSAILEKDGEFHFTQKRPEFSPEFYRIRVKDQVINFAIDSTEEVTIRTTRRLFSSGYSIEGSESSKIMASLNQLSSETKTSITANVEKYKKKEINDDRFKQMTDSVLQRYKNSAKSVIYQNPRSAAAYFALFQKVYNYLIFNYTDADDVKAFGAVATSFNVYYPNNPRTKHLVEFTMQGMKASRQEEGFAVPQDKVKVLGSFEIDLPDIRGRNIRLSSLTGKLVLLSFTAYQTEFSPSLNMTLGDLYTQYKSRGFEIYQVSLDQDENFWKVSASNIPWVCVYDRNAQNSEFAAMYNVTQLPTLFLLNRQGEIVKRVTNISTLKSELAKLL